MNKILAIVAGITLILTACSSGPSAEELCLDMKNGETGKDHGQLEDMTEKQYMELRSKFENVDDENLSEHGTKLLDVAWQVSQLPEGEEMGALAFMGPLTNSMQGVISACADHGVTLNLADN